MAKGQAKKVPVKVQAKVQPKAKTEVQADNMVFSLDIGTRSIIGMVGVVVEDKVKIIAIEKEEHNERAMIDGQIENIEKVSALAKKVKKRLEDKVHTKLKRVSVAAAGRALRTSRVDYEMVLEAYRQLEKEGRLTIKICEQSQFEDLEQLKGFVEQGYHTGAGTDYVKIGPMKIISDGSLGARTACLSQPYADSPDTSGIPIFSQEQLDEMIAWGHCHGMQAAVHAIGDGSMEQVVSAIEKALLEYPREDHRHGIVHCQITTKDLLGKFKELSLHAYIQSIFLDYDSKIVESRVGQERALDTYQFKTLMDMGCDVSNGSDCPVETPSVMKGIQCAVTRTSLDGSRTFLPAQALTVEEALASYTVMGARASFEEEKKGMLRPGMAADFVVFPQNLLETPPDSLGRVPVDETWVDGIRVYKRS